MIRLFSIEDHWLVTDGLRTKFRKSRDEIVITCSAETIEDAIEGKHDDAFDIILLDLFIPGTEPLENIRKLKDRYPGKPIVILTGEEQEIWRMQVAEAGVVAYITKHARKGEMVDILKRVSEGENILMGQMGPVTNHQPAPHKDQDLFRIKPTEKELLSQLAKGLLQKQIALNLNMSESAIEKMLRKLRKQFFVNSTLKLVRLLEQYHFFSGSDKSSTGH